MMDMAHLPASVRAEIQKLAQKEADTLEVYQEATNTYECSRLTTNVLTQKLEVLDAEKRAEQLSGTDKERMAAIDKQSKDVKAEVVAANKETENRGKEMRLAKGSWQGAVREHGDKLKSLKKGAERA